MANNDNEIVKIQKIFKDNNAELNQLALKLQTQFNNSLYAKLSPIIQNQEFLLAYGKSQKAWQSCIHNVAKQISQVKIPIINNDLQLTIQKIAEQNRSFQNIDWKAIENTLIRYTELLIEQQLPPLNEIEYVEIRILIEMEDKIEARKSLIEHMTRVYNERRITNMLEEWKSFDIAKKRIHIFEEIIWAHQNKKYNIVIPALIAQFEGLICDIVNVQGIRLDDVLKSHIKTILTTDDKCEVANVAKEFWINVLLDNTVKKDRFLSRHAILHGQDINYGNYEKSLILLITMDSILEWFNKVSEDVIEHSKEEAQKIIQEKQKKDLLK
ncbi:hypothetical protein [Sulfurospirillum sp.]|uniref:hypothetical protein n=1 Tax=Sulfurospirillum sp. TaxID=2053622 RepID=UPI002FDEDCB5